MATDSVRIRYRPLRLGWCVRDGNWDDLRSALRCAHAFWGGASGPVLTIGAGENDQAARLVRLYEMDAFFPVGDDPQLKAFVDRFPHLRWPGIRRQHFIADSEGRGYASFLDVYHPGRTIYEEHIDGKAEPTLTATLYEWAADDPLKDVFLAQFGEYPPSEEIHFDYGAMMERNLKGTRVALPIDGPVPADAYKKLTPSALSRFDLWPDRDPNWDFPGLYVGEVNDFADVVNFWNLRAPNVQVLFFDPAHEARLGALETAYLKLLKERPREATHFESDLSIWSKRGREVDLKPFQAFQAQSIGRVEMDDGIWNGLNLKPPLMYIEDERVLASRSENEGIPSLTFELREKPFYEGHGVHTQHYVASIEPLAFGEDEQVTFSYPFLPELNDFYRYQACLAADGARSERTGLGIITDVGRDTLTIRALRQRSLVASVFEAFGMKAQTSEAGRIASRLIQQMGGVQGCRVFKIAGVRKLIEKYKPLQSFTRGEAMQIIGDVDPATSIPNFARYEPLFIEPREGPNLKSSHVFDFMARKKVFRVGLKFICPNCELEFWTSLDVLATEVTCEHCGQRFNVTPHLKDRDWAYRRSGLFGREDHQQGAIPVALTLQQLDTVLKGGTVFVTSMNIESTSGAFAKCETDLVIISKKGFYDDRLAVAIGECKGHCEITAQNVRNLTQMADAFPRDRIAPFIVFSKTAPFTAIEIARCRAAQPAFGKRMILLSDRELEPHFVYEWAEKDFVIDPTVISLDDLANTTHALYFDPKPKNPPAVIAGDTPHLKCLRPWYQRPSPPGRAIYFERYRIIDSDRRNDKHGETSATGCHTPSERGCRPSCYRRERANCAT